MISLTIGGSLGSKLSLPPTSKLSVRPSVRLSVHPYVYPSICPSIRMSVRPLAIQKNAENGDSSLKNHCGHVLIHFGLILLPAGVCSTLKTQILEARIYNENPIYKLTKDKHKPKHMRVLYVQLNVQLQTQNSTKKNNNNNEK